MVSSGQSGAHAHEVQGKPLLITGVPLTALAPVDVQYYEGLSLDELANDARAASASACSAPPRSPRSPEVCSASGHRDVCVRPLLDVGRAADAIAGGRLDTRLPTGTDPDVDRLATPFNHMATALEDRIDRDARFASEVSHELRSPLMTLSATVEVLENMPRRDARAARRPPSTCCRPTSTASSSSSRTCSRSHGSTPARSSSTSRRCSSAEMVIQAVSVHRRRRHVPVMYDEDVERRGGARRQAPVRPGAGQPARQRREVRRRGAPASRSLAVGRARCRSPWRTTAPGVPAEDRDLIFDRFSRGTESGNRSPDSGVGLGLALVERARPPARRHACGSRIDRRGEPARGSWSSCPSSSYPRPEPSRRRGRRRHRGGRREAGRASSVVLAVFALFLVAARCGIPSDDEPRAIPEAAVPEQAREPRGSGSTTTTIRHGHPGPDDLSRRPGQNSSERLQPVSVGVTVPADQAQLPRPRSRS